MDRIKDAKRWMQQKHGRAVLAPFTGQDFRAWGAFVLLLDLYAAGDSTGRAHAVDAMVSAMKAAQASVVALFLDVVPYAVDGREGATLALRIASTMNDADHGAHARCR